jgi:enoyl-CoA hydratase
MQANQAAVDGQAGDNVVEYRVSDGIATITMNRPEYRNAQN